MKAEEWARQAWDFYEGVTGPKGLAGYFERAQQEARAAALEERDREWAKAVRAVEMAHFGVLLCHPDGGAEGDAPCVVCPALRALLEGRHEG